MTQSQNCFSVSRGAGGVPGPRETRPFLSTVWGTGLIQDATSAEKLKTNIHQPPPAPGPPGDARPEIPRVGAGGPAGGRNQEETRLQCPSPAPQRQTQLPLIRGGPHSPDRTLTPLGTPLPQTGLSAPPGTPLPGWNPLPYQAPLAPFQVGAELPHTQTAGEDLMTVSPQ